MIRLFLPLACLLVSLGCSSPVTMESAAAQHRGASIAVVSVAANNYGDSLQGFNSASSTDLMGSRVAKMLSIAESELASRWTVVPASGFVGKSSFQQQKGGNFEVGLAKLPEGTLPAFALNRDQLIKAGLTPQQAKALAQATGSDLLAVIYSEWAVATGRFVPTAKALTKNVMSIYDANGQEVFRGRQDAIGTRTLGALGRAAVNEETIDQWVESYQTALTTLVR